MFYSWYKQIKQYYNGVKNIGKISLDSRLCERLQRTNYVNKNTTAQSGGSNPTDYESSTSKSYKKTARYDSIVLGANCSFPYLGTHRLNLTRYCLWFNCQNPSVAKFYKMLKERDVSILGRILMEVTEVQYQKKTICLLDIHVLYVLHSVYGEDLVAKARTSDWVDNSFSLRNTLYSYKLSIFFKISDMSISELSLKSALENSETTLSMVIQSRNHSQIQSKWALFMIQVLQWKTCSKINPSHPLLLVRNQYSSIMFLDKKKKNGGQWRESTNNSYRSLKKVMDYLSTVEVE